MGAPYGAPPPGGYPAGAPYGPGGGIPPGGIPPYPMTGGGWFCRGGGIPKSAGALCCDGRGCCCWGGGAASSVGGGGGGGMSATVLLIGERAGAEGRDSMPESSGSWDGEESFCFSAMAFLIFFNWSFVHCNDEIKSSSLSVRRSDPVTVVCSIKGDE